MGGIYKSSYPLKFAAERDSEYVPEKVGVPGEINFLSDQLNVRDATDFLLFFVDHWTHIVQRQAFVGMLDFLPLLLVVIADIQGTRSCLHKSPKHHFLKTCFRLYCLFKNCIYFLE